MYSYNINFLDKYVAQQNLFKTYPSSIQLKTINISIIYEYVY